MSAAMRFALVALTLVALAPVRADEAAHPPRDGAPVAVNACLNQKERRAVSESGNVVRLAAAMKAAKSKLPGTVVRARLCHGPDGLVYVLTVLAHDGKVERLTVDAVKGSLVGGDLNGVF
jgi:hypothetical protein